jgi:1-acyl-sn-glycerol-3-phosphate acyltransferase
VQMQSVLARKGSVLGIHPEGKRSKDTDPWHMLPFRPGVGQIIQTAHPETTILPFFILGLSNRFIGEMYRNFLPPDRRGERVRIWFGAPQTAEQFQQHGDAVTITGVLQSQIRALADEDRAQYERSPLHAGAVD